MPTAVLVPQTALLVPGAAGRSDVLGDVRAAALGAVRDLVADGPDGVLLVAPGTQGRVLDGADACASMVGLGIAERHLGWPAPCRLPGCPEHMAPGDPGRVVGAAAATGLRLLAAAGWSGPTTVHELDAAAPPATVVVPAGPGRGVVVLGSLSARHGPEAPRAADPRASEVDAAFAAALEDPTPEQVARLAAPDVDLAAELDIGGAAPWRLLAGLVAGRDVSGELLAADRSLGVDHRVWRWRWAG